MTTTKTEDYVWSDLHCGRLISAAALPVERGQKAELYEVVRNSGLVYLRFRDDRDDYFGFTFEDNDIRRDMPFMMPVILWAPIDAKKGDVVFQIDIRAMSVGGTIEEQRQTVVVGVGKAVEKNLIECMPTDPVTRDHFYVLRVTRLRSDDRDTYAGAVALFEIDFPVGEKKEED